MSDSAPATRGSPVPPEADLRSYPSVMIPVQLIRDSPLALTGSPEMFKALISLWAAAWHQSPAGSLPDDDRQLALLAAVAEKKWRTIRGEVLAGFELHPDGRLYHPLLSANVEQAWKKKVENRKKSAGMLEGKFTKSDTPKTQLSKSKERSRNANRTNELSPPPEDDDDVLFPDVE
jgi:uncharacterized protein YdaU (DUF1376 family)